MDHSLFPFAVMMSILLFGCVPFCSAKRNGRGGAGNPALNRPAVEAECASRAPAVPVRSGDVIFISVPYYLFQKVASATACPANHVGIVFHDARRGWLVAESALPVSRCTPLESFIARSKGGWCEVRRVKGGLTEAQVAALRAECDRRMGILYHTGFRYESRRMFCSKFVYDVYRSALGIEVGELETFSHLLKRNPEAGLGFWRAWYLGRIPWERVTVTPASQFESKVLETVWRPEMAI